jgi:hypothetical protein
MSRRFQLLLFATFWAFIVPLAHASSGGEDRVQFGRNIVVNSDETTGDLVCIACSIRVDGASHDTVAIGGSITVNGTVKGDLAAIGGGVTLGDDATVDGDISLVGGHLNRSPNAVIKGDISSHSRGPLFLGFVLVPLVPILLIVGLVVWLVKPNRRPTPVRTWQPPPPTA